MKYFSIDYWLDKVLLLSFLLNEQSKNGYCFVSGNEIKNWSMPSAIENRNPVLFNPILNNSEATSELVSNRIKRGGRGFMMLNLPIIAGSIRKWKQSPTQQLQEFLPWQIQAQRKEQIPWFTEQQIKAFTEKQIPWFTPKQIPHFTTQQMSAFIWCKQLQKLTSIPIQCFSEEQAKRLASDQTQELPTTDINKMDLQNESSISKGNSSLSNM